LLVKLFPRRAQALKALSLKKAISKTLVEAGSLALEKGRSNSKKA